MPREFLLVQGVFKIGRLDDLEKTAEIFCNGWAYWFHLGKGKRGGQDKDGSLPSFEVVKDMALETLTFWGFIDFHVLLIRLNDLEDFDVRENGLKGGMGDSVEEDVALGFVVQKT
jgi:hypothetical protein